MSSVFNITEAVKKQELQDKKNEDDRITKCENQFNSIVENFLNNQFAKMYQTKQKKFTFFTDGYIDYSGFHGGMRNCPMMHRLITLNTGEKLEIVGKQEYEFSGKKHYNLYNISNSIQP